MQRVANCRLGRRQASRLAQPPTPPHNPPRSISRPPNPAQFATAAQGLTEACWRGAVSEASSMTPFKAATSAAGLHCAASCRTVTSWDTTTTSTCDGEGEQVTRVASLSASASVLQVTHQLGLLTCSAPSSSLSTLYTAGCTTAVARQAQVNEGTAPTCSTPGSSSSTLCTRGTSMGQQMPEA